MIRWEGLLKKISRVEKGFEMRGLVGKRVLRMGVRRGRRGWEDG